MLRQLLASASTLAVVVGFAAAPYAHFHPAQQRAANDSSHAHGHGVLHSHTTSHEDRHHHDAPADGETGNSHGLSVDVFVFAPVKTHALTNAVVVIPQAIVPPRMASLWTIISPHPPPDHAAPSTLPSSPRAPPIPPLRAI
jgi:hypothetical protein